MHSQTKQQNLADKSVYWVVKGLWNRAKMVKYKLAAHVQRQERKSSKKVKDWHSRAKHETEVKTDQNHCIKSLEVKLFRKKNLIKLSLVFRKSFKLDNDKFSLLKEPVENDIEPGTNN